MGYDPFWPISLATINVLCVPAARLSLKRFNEIFDAVQQVAEVSLKDIRFKDGPKNDHITPSKFPNGSILFNYGTATGDSHIERFPFEPNANPQIILGFLEDSHDPVGTETAIESTPLSESVEHQFLAQYASPSSKAVCKILHWTNSRSSPSSEITLIVPGLDATSLYEPMVTIAQFLVVNVLNLTSALGNKPINSPLLLKAPSQHPLHGVGIVGRTTASRTSPSVTAVEPESSPNSEPSVNDVEKPLVQKGRYALVVGMLSLQVGSWYDAMRLLTQAADEARSDRDILWEGRAVECLLVCMILLAWKDIDFVVPSGLEIPKSAFSAPSFLKMRPTSPPAESTINGANAENHTAGGCLKLVKTGASIVQMALDMYGRLEPTAPQEIPRALLTEARLRLLNLLIFFDNQRGHLEQAALTEFIIRRKQAVPPLLHKITSPPNSSIANVADLLISTLPAAESTSHSAHYLTTLISLISTLSSLGSARKYAFYFRNLLQRLAPVLVHARKLGASEAGVHPTAAISTVNPALGSNLSYSQNVARTLLSAAAEAYGIPLVQPTPASMSRKANLDEVRTNLLYWCAVQFSGDVFLKMEILRLCIGVCDALPDHEGSLLFTSNLLRSSMQTLTISTTLPSPRPCLSAEEQLQFVQSLKHSIVAATKTGLLDVRAAYWDDFLVRDIVVSDHYPGSKLTPHSPNELSLISSTMSQNGRDPLIFNPFAKSKSAGAEPVIVAGELVTFSVLLQNPLEVDIEVDDISLLAEGCGFQASHHNLVMGPLCSQVFFLTGTASESGTLTISGCQARIRSCLEQEFLIFKSSWKSPRRVKQKPMTKLTRSIPQEGFKSLQMTDLDINYPANTVLVLQVIVPQPQVQVDTTTLMQPSVMLLEGEKRSITLTLRNQSSQVAADLVLLTLDDNVTNSLHEALSRKDILPIETYEIQHQLKFRPSIKMTDRTEDSASEIMPRQRESYTFDLFGRPGLLNATVQVNVACLGSPRSEIQNVFYTRQTHFHVAVTVNGSVDIPRCNVVPLSGDFTWAAIHDSAQQESSATIQRSGTGDLAANIRSSSSPDSYCLLTLDLRNIWPQPLTVELLSRGKLDDNTERAEEHVAQETLQPGHISRVVLLVPRLFIAEPYAPIPNLGSQRQFVVSASKLSLDAEAASRESFWYREALLKHLSGTWVEEKTGRHGEVDLRKGIRLSARMIDALKIDHVEVNFDLKPFKAAAGSEEEDGKEDRVVEQVGNSHFVLQTESFATLFVRVHNRTRDKLRLLLRLQPSLRDQPHNIALDLSRRFTWSGVLQRTLHPFIEPGETYEAELGVMALADGNYEVNAAVEEIQGRRKVASNAAVDLTGVSPERRIWHARSPCLIDAIDATT